jgi:hypothetical protein
MLVKLVLCSRVIKRRLSIYEVCPAADTTENVTLFTTQNSITPVVINKLNKIINDPPTCPGAGAPLSSNYCALRLIGFSTAA